MYKRSKHVTLYAGRLNLNTLGVNLKSLNKRSQTTPAYCHCGTTERAPQSATVNIWIQGVRPGAQVKSASPVLLPHLPMGPVIKKDKYTKYKI